MQRIRLRKSSHCILTVPFTSGTTSPRTHVKWNFRRFLTFHHLPPQVNYQQNQISPSPLLTNCINQVRPRLNHTIRHCTDYLPSFVTTVNTLSATTSVTDGSLDRSALELRASLRLNFLVRRIADAAGACSSRLPASTTITTIDAGQVMVGYELVTIRFRKSALIRWSLKLPLPSCSSTSRFRNRKPLPRVRG